MLSLRSPFLGFLALTLLAEVRMPHGQDWELLLRGERPLSAGRRQPPCSAAVMCFFTGLCGQQLTWGLPLGRTVFTTFSIGDAIYLYF